jgi:group I intron endonuclease
MYIGSTSVSFKQRWSKHLNYLTRSKHPSRHLQNAWNKYGVDQFAFEILEVISDPNIVIQREQAWINMFWESGTLYNLSPTAASTRGFRFPDEAKMKISAGQRAHFRNPEHRKAMSDRVRAWHATKEGADKHSTGQKRRFSTPEGRQQIERLRERFKSPEWREYMSKREKARMQNPRERERLAEIGRKVHQDQAIRERWLESLRKARTSNKSRQAMSQAQKARFSTQAGRAASSRARRAKQADGTPRIWSLQAPDGFIYQDIPNLAEFCREQGLTYSSILGLFSGKLRSHKGWTRPIY